MGARAFILTLVCVEQAYSLSSLFEKITKRENTVSDLSAIVTGLLLAYNLPPTFPYWMAIIGCFVAIVIVKQLFGGIGQNFANPAITARIVLLVSFSTDMAVWAKPQERFLSAADAVTGATPLTQFAEGSTDSLPSNMEMFIGTIGGSLGEISAAGASYRRGYTACDESNFAGNSGSLYWHGIRIYMGARTRSGFPYSRGRRNAWSYIYGD